MTWKVHSNHAVFSSPVLIPAPATHAPVTSPTTFSVAKIDPENCWSENETDWLDVVKLIHMGCQRIMPITQQMELFLAVMRMEKYHGYQNRSVSIAGICCMNEVDKSVVFESIWWQCLPYVSKPLANPIIPPTSHGIFPWLFVSINCINLLICVLFKIETTFENNSASCLLDTLNTSFLFSQWT